MTKDTVEDFIEWDVDELENIKEFFVSVWNVKKWGECGAFFEVVSRREDYLDMFFLGYLKNVTNANGNSLWGVFDKIQGYVFKTKEIDLSNKEFPILKGKAKKYDPLQGSIDSLEEKLVVYMNEPFKIKKRYSYDL